MALHTCEWHPTPSALSATSPRKTARVPSPRPSPSLPHPLGAPGLTCLVSELPCLTCHPLPCQRGTQARGNDSAPTLTAPRSPRGERYIGMWQADQRHGPGVLVTQAGVCYQGTFQADKMVVSGATRVCPGAACRSPLLRSGWAGGKRRSSAPEAATPGQRGSALPPASSGLGQVPLRRRAFTAYHKDQWKSRSAGRGTALPAASAAAATGP